MTGITVLIGLHAEDARVTTNGLFKKRDKAEVYTGNRVKIAIAIQPYGFPEPQRVLCQLHLQQTAALSRRRTRVPNLYTIR